MAVDPNAFFLLAIPVADVAKGLAAVGAGALGSEAASLDVQSNIDAFRLSLPSTPANALPGQAKAFCDEQATRPLVTCAHGHLRNQNNTISVNYVPLDGALASIKITTGGDPTRAKLLYEQITRHFKLTSFADLLRSRGDGAEHVALQMRERSVAALDLQLGKLSEFLTDLALRETEARRQAQEELERSYRERSEKLAAETAAKQAEIDAHAARRVEAIEQRESALEKKREAFETREAKFVRRDLLRRIEEVLNKSESFAVSEATAKKRGLVHKMCWGLMAVGLIIIATFVYRVLGADSPDWKLLVPLGAGTATFVTTAIYYLKWNDRWFREHADSEFDAKRYKADILRASWVAELAAERDAEGKSELSPELLEAFTRNLFRDVGPSHESEHPFDGLTAIMRRATGVSIGQKGFSLRAAPAEPRRPKPRTTNA